VKKSLTKYRHFSIALALLVLIFVLFGKTLQNHFNSDDFLVVYQAEQSTYTAAGAVQEFLRPSWNLYYRPLIVLFFNGLEGWFGSAPTGYHLMSLLFYSALCIEIYFLGILLIRRRLMALAAALVFMTTTSHAEIIFWISSLNGLVENVFTLAALIAFIRWRQSSKQMCYWLSLALFVAALFLKESAIVLPAVLILYDALLGGEFRWPDALRRTTRSAGVFVLLGFLFVILRFFVMRQVHLPASLTSFEGRTFLLGAWNTLLMTLSPIDWALPVNWLNRLEAGGIYFYIPAAILLLLAGMIPLLLRKYRVLFLLGWILAGTLPVIGLGLVPSERHVALSSAGAALLTVIIVFGVARRLSQRTIFADAGAVCLVLLFSATSFYFLNQRRVMWKTASDIAAGIVEQTVTACPAPGPDTTFFYLNVPDTYDSALVFRFENLSYALRLSYRNPTLKAVRIITPERVSPAIFSNPAYLYFRLSAMGGNMFLRSADKKYAFLSQNLNYLEKWPLYKESPFFIYSRGRLLPATSDDLKEVLQRLYSLS
jgi:hypothetical protein